MTTLTSKQNKRTKKKQSIYVDKIMVFGRVYRVYSVRPVYPSCCISARTGDEGHDFRGFSPSATTVSQQSGPPSDWKSGLSRSRQKKNRKYNKKKNCLLPPPLTGSPGPGVFSDAYPGIRGTPFPGRHRAYIGRDCESSALTLIDNLHTMHVKIEASKSGYYFPIFRLVLFLRLPRLLTEIMYTYSVFFFFVLFRSRSSPRPRAHRTRCPVRRL